MQASGHLLPPSGGKKPILLRHWIQDKGLGCNEQTHEGMRHPCAPLEMPTMASLVLSTQENQKKA